MNNRFHFRGRVDTPIIDGVLYIPREVEDFYRLKRSYVLKEEETDRYSYLTVYPIVELNVRLLSEGVTSKRLPSEFVPLEKIVRKDGIKGLKLPPHSLDYLGLGRNSTGRIIGGIFPDFEVWKPEDFDKRESLADLASVRSALAQKGI